MKHINSRTEREFSKSEWNFYLQRAISNLIGNFYYNVCCLPKQNKTKWKSYILSVYFCELEEHQWEFLYPCLIKERILNFDQEYLPTLIFHCLGHYKGVIHLLGNKQLLCDIENMVLGPYAKLFKTWADF